MLDLLRSLEWANVGPCCPSCERVKMDGHAPDCRLDRAIRDLASSAIEEVPEPSPLVVGDRVVALTPHGWADATILRIEASGPVLIRTESGVTWLVERDRVHRQDQTSEPTVNEMAIRTLYREHKAKHADPPDEELERVLGRSVTREEEPPTDPSALAAWLFARVVPGQTAVEYRTAAGIVGRSLVARCYAGTDRVAIGIYGGETVLVPGQGSTLLTFTRLLNPDGTVLWEAK